MADNQNESISELINQLINIDLARERKCQRQTSQEKHAQILTTGEHVIGP